MKLAITFRSTCGYCLKNKNCINHFKKTKNFILYTGQKWRLLRLSPGAFTIFAFPVIIIMAIFLG